MATGTAVSANLAVFTIAKELLHVPFIMPLRPEAPPVPLPMSMVMMASAIPAIGATLWYGILWRFVPRAAFVFRIASAAFFILSMAGPFSLTADISTKVSLALMHLIAGVCIVYVLTTFASD
jgi:hypothetical protein